MRSSTPCIHCLLMTAATLAIVYEDRPPSAHADDGPPNVAADGNSRPVQAAPKHFILNPDYGRPAGYPVEISLKQLEAFLKTQEIIGVGCGGMTWEGTKCGMSGYLYGEIETPWLKDRVELDASYAVTKTGTFLAMLTLGQNTYQRADRNSNKLVWERNYEPGNETQAIHRILYGSDSAKRKKLCTGSA